MYIYDNYDQRIVDERVAQFKEQTERYLAGGLTEEQFLPLRLQNGLYVQRYAPMLRVAVPYGLLSSAQVRKLAHIARTYDKGYAHISTRTNVQYNWPELKDVPEILAELAIVQMHAIQTSGNCIRNTTTDQFAGVTPNELVDARPYCEIIRQWSTFHPEFAFLPRKFKIAVNSHLSDDRAATMLHDIGIKIVKNNLGEIGFAVYVGGGLGRTPIVASLVKEFLPEKDLLTYLDAVLRVYNLNGRRDNKYKARIKITVQENGVDKIRELVEARFEERRQEFDGTDQALLAEIKTNIDAWQNDVTEVQIALRRMIGDAKTMDDMARLIGEARGKQYFDNFRQLMADPAAARDAAAMTAAMIDGMWLRSTLNLTPATDEAFNEAERLCKAFIDSLIATSGRTDEI